MKFPLYLDYHATTPVDPRVLETMLPYFTEKFGNAASRNHAYGWAASQAVEEARERVGALLGAPYREVVFTSGATESNNLAIKGVACGCRSKGNHIVTAVTEHSSVLDSCRHLEHDGYEVTYLPVEADGLVDPERLEAALTSRTILVSIMAANNEIGVIQPLAEIGRIARKHAVPLHTDASQYAGKVPFNVSEMPVDLVSLTAHKMYGPKGVGALWVRKKDPCVELAAMMHGGGHERGMRSGTLNVPAIVGFGRAAEVSQHELPTEPARLARLRDRLLEGLTRGIPNLQVNGSRTARLPQNLNVSFPGIEGESLGVAMDDIAVSSGAACSTAKTTPSHVLTAIGIEADLAHATLRFGLGRWTTDEEIEYAIGKVSSVVARLRELRAELDA